MEGGEIFLLLLYFFLCPVEAEAAAAAVAAKAAAVEAIEAAAAALAEGAARKQTSTKLPLHRCDLHNASAATSRP